MQPRNAHNVAVGSDFGQRREDENFGAVDHVDAADRGRARALLGRRRRHLGRGLERDRDPAAVLSRSLRDLRLVGE